MTEYGGNMTDNSSERTNTQHDNNLDFFDTGFTSEEMAPTPPSHILARTCLSVDNSHTIEFQ